MPAYRFLFYDLLSNIPKDELPLQNVHYGYMLNGAGNFQGSISTKHPKATQDTLDEGKTVMYVDRDGEIVWAGMLWQTNVTGGSNNSTVVLTGLELWSLFQDIKSRGRFIRETMVFEDVDQLTIAQTLISYAQSSFIHGPTANYGIVVGSETSGVIRTRTYEPWDRTNIGKAVENLAALEDGFDFRVRARRDGFDIIKELLFFYPSTPTPEANVIFEWGRNILGYSYPIDALNMAKKVDALGAGEGAQMLIATAEDTTLDTYPMREVDYAYKDVTQMATLQAHANADLVRNRMPDAVPSLITKTEVDAPIGSFFPGNTAVVRINDGKVQINRYMKIVQQEIRIEPDGSEEMTVRFNEFDEATA
jgi:hypothetical protein